MKLTVDSNKALDHDMIGIRMLKLSCDSILQTPRVNFQNVSTKW